MSYTPPRELLRGLSVDVAECYGKPHIGAYYDNSSINSHKMTGVHSCPCCGAPATNVHHCPPKSKGKFILHGHVLRPALFALCGSGTTGCHGEVHKKLIIPEWHWFSDEYAEQWWSGKLLETYKPNSNDLYEFGAWKFVKKS